MLDDDERRRASRFHFASDRDSFVAAHALARAMLSSATGQPTNFWRYVIGAFGKPALARECGMEGLRFNISHARDVVACAVGFHDLGLDVESSQRAEDINVADHVLAPEEALILKSAPLDAQPSIFFRFWTLKEAFVKATGEGFSRPPESFSFRLDPIEIKFHPERAAPLNPEEPKLWLFAERRPTDHAHLALAVRRDPVQPAKLDLRAAQPDEIDGSS